MAIVLLLFFLGIPVSQPNVIAKCGTCHPSDEHGNMQRVSYARSTPEGWQIVLKRMLRTRRVMLTQVEAREILKYLSDSNGLAPEESKPLMYDPERRVHDEGGSAAESLTETCGKCHALARALSWRRTAEDWKEFSRDHAARYKFKLPDEMLKAIADAAPLDSSQWASWAARAHSPELTGRWLVTAHMMGRGKFLGEMIITPGASEGEVLTRVNLRSIQDGSTLERSGRAVVYAGHEWRGRSKGASLAASAPDDLQNEARETMWVKPDGSRIEGRWFWGQYQEFGFDVTMQRPSANGTLLALDVNSLQAGSTGNRVRFLGDHLPDKVSTADVRAGDGFKIRRIVSNSANEIVAEIDVEAAAVPGWRPVSVGHCESSSKIAIYDRVDYIRVLPESAMAAFGDESHPRGFQQFEAIGYQRGPDGRIHTADDLELGPLKAEWSMEVFYETDPSQRATVGNVSDSGLFSPAPKNPGANYDIWAVATAKAMTSKSYVVVTVPTYVFEGHRYVRDLDRWVIEEP